MLMAVMNSDVKGNHRLAVLLPNFDAPLPPIRVTTTIPGASPLVVDVMEHLTAQMEAMNEIVDPVTTAEGLVLVPHVYVQRDVMEDQSAMMEAMNEIVGPAPAAITAEGTVTVLHQFVQSDVMEVQSAMMSLMRKTAIQVLNACLTTKKFNAV